MNSHPNGFRLTSPRERNLPEGITSASCGGRRSANSFEKRTLTKLVINKGLKNANDSFDFRRLHHFMKNTAYLWPFFFLTLFTPLILEASTANPGGRDLHQKSAFRLLRQTDDATFDQPQLMAKSGKYLIFKVMCLRCGQLPVVVGAAPATDLFRLSFADVLREAEDQGYQRPIDPRHSREFRKYIEQPGATTIPLTFNLRSESGDGWSLDSYEEGAPATLSVRVPSADAPSVLAQVDCQHRLGMMADSTIPLTFQCFLGLNPQDEMAIFNVINAKAKGLSPSLLDYHATKLIADLETIRLELFIAKRLNDDHESVWFGKVKLGGASTQGSKRRASLRGLQTATKAFLQRRPFDDVAHLDAWQRYEVVRDFWTAVVDVWPGPWAKPRRYLLTKCVGVTALSMLAADVVASALASSRPLTAETFREHLSLLSDVDWSNKGPFQAYGGRGGATEVHKHLAFRLRGTRLSVVRTAI